MGKALGYALLLWMIGFVWGSIVFMTPALKSIGPVPAVSKYPVISIPLLIVYLFLLYWLSKFYLQDAKQKARTGLVLGLILFIVNIVLDAVVYWGGFKSADYFAYLSIWVSYSIMILIPWLTGKFLQGSSV